MKTNKEKVVEILKRELFPMQLVNDDDPIEIVGLETAAEKIDQLYSSCDEVNLNEIKQAVEDYRNSRKWYHVDIDEEAGFPMGFEEGAIWMQSKLNR